MEDAMTYRTYNGLEALRHRQDCERKIAELPPGSVALALCDRMILRLECDLEAPDWMFGDQPEQQRHRMREDAAAWKIERDRLMRQDWYQKARREVGP
jgi:hypothetical protein